MKLGFVLIIAACSTRAAPPESAPRMADPPETAQLPAPSDAPVVPPYLDAAVRDAGPAPQMDAPAGDAAPADAFPFSPDARP